MGFKLCLHISSKVILAVTILFSGVLVTSQVVNLTSGSKSAKRD